MDGRAGNSTSEQDLKKLVFVGSKNEEIAHKINNQQEIRLGKQLKYYEREKTVFLKSFRAEHQAALEKHQKVKSRLLELGYARKTNSSRTLRGGKHVETPNKVRFFITADSRRSLDSTQNKCVTDSRRIQSAQEVRKTAVERPGFYNET